MMETDNTSQDSAVNGSDNPSMGLKRKTCFRNGTGDRELMESAEKLPLMVIPENGLTCNGGIEVEDMKVSSDHKSNSTQSVFSDVEDPHELHNSECVEEKVSTKQRIKPSPTKDDSDIVSVSGKDRSPRNYRSDEKVSGDEFSGDNQNDCFIDTDKSAHNSAANKNDPGSQSHTETECDVSSEKVRSRRKQGSSSRVVELAGATTSVDHTDSMKEGAENIKSSDEVKETTIRGNEILTKEEDTKNNYVKSYVSSKGGKRRAKGVGIGVNNNVDTADNDSKLKVVKKKDQTLNLPKNGQVVVKKEQQSDPSAKDIEIIGEPRLIQPNKSERSLRHGSHVAKSQVSQSLTVTGNNVSTSSLPVPGIPSFPASSQGFIPAGRGARGIPPLAPGFVGSGGAPGHVPHIVPLFVPPVAPPKPKSSLDQIELIRWEIQNRINTRPKYFKPCPSSELGPLAKFLFDIGSDLIKEAVYHDLVKIQSKKNSNDKLNDKEKEDLGKLKQIEMDLFATVGHLKLKLKKKCKVCHFQTESNNVMFYHKQYPHEDNKFMRCAHCTFVTKQAMAFKLHMESEHGIQPKLHDKKGTHECDLCPYENNQEQKLTLHKQRCIKQFRPLFNLHPSCLSGAEINLCLENIFYKPIIPKNLKLLQQRHAQQQAALADAKRQQAEIQALVATKKSSVSTKEQQHPQQLVTRRMPASTARFNAPPSGEVLPQPVRYNANTKGPRQTVASMLNNKQNPLALPTAASNKAAPSSGFEVCEICGGYVKDRKALRIHFFYAHRIDLPFNLFERAQAPLYCATCYVRFWTAQGLRKHIDSHKEENQTRGVLGKCISCGHHVLNLLLHMRVVHNRELQHYINALVCMFCGSHFGSRQECERHIPKVHGEVDPVTGTLKSSPNVPIQQQTQKAPSNQKKTTNNSLVKGSVCVLCNLNFGRNVDLTRHCMRMHHTCMKCGMVVIDKASLMKHTCLSSPSGTRNCSLCGEIGFHPAYYVKHLRDKHLKKFSINLDKLSSQTIEYWTQHSGPNEQRSGVMMLEVSGLGDIVAVSQRKSPSLEITPRKRPKIGPACKTGRKNVNLTLVAGKIKTEDQEQHMEHMDKEMIEDADKEMIKGNDKEMIEGADKEMIEGADKEMIKGNDKEMIEGVDKEMIEGAEKEMIEGADKEMIEGVDKKLVDMEGTSADVDSRSADSHRGEKRQLLSASPEYEEPSKRHKSS